MPNPIRALAQRIKVDGPSLKVRILDGEIIVVTPPFQKSVAVASWEDYQRLIKEGRICFPDNECAW